ncbi:MAG: aldehyde ferredoxin oxidoreductase [Candidatus Lokiarchaeota archaeon]|nr:aldehyde ferredoxin oxidoreductase [Candidatus Lokiarchaeota archaeon]
MRGYMGKYLDVNLDNESVQDLEIEEEIREKFIGGLGLGAYICYKEIPKDIDGFDSKNIIAFMTGPYTASGAPACSRYEVISKSPLNGLLGAANAGGFFGPELKLSGYDGIIIKGKAADPVYLLINEGEVEIKDASNIWGHDSFETEDKIRNERGDDGLKIASIGQAGENLVKFASIMNDRGRAAGRNGLGAIMGSKKLKAIAVKRKPGTKITVAKPEKLKELTKLINKSIKSNMVTKMFSTHGTPMMVSLGSIIGDVPVKNFQSEWMDNFYGITASSIRKTILIRNKTCYGCAVACKRHVKVDVPKYKMEAGSGPEYEAVAALGSNCMINNIFAIAKANDLCNRFGLDVISAGCATAFAMEAYEKGLISKEDLGYELNWGSAEGLISLIKDIVLRKGIAKGLGEGTRDFARELGEIAEEFLVEVKGLEVPMHEPRANIVMALNYATSPLGAKHTTAAASIFFMYGMSGPDFGHTAKYSIHALDPLLPEGKVKTTKNIQDYHYMMDSVTICDNLSVVPVLSNHYFSALTALITGWPQKWKTQFLKTGERILNLCRAFNLKHGATKNDDYLPRRILENPLPQSLGKAPLIKLKPLLQQYYMIRGWDWDTGQITSEKLEELSLDDIVKN